MSVTDDLYRKTAREVRDLLARREVSALELVEAAAARITATDPALNALPTLCLDRAREHACRLDGERGQERPAQHLHGVPIVVKDLNAVAGVRWTEGSRVFGDRIAARSDLLVEQLEANGAIVLGKSNTPEFGAGGNTVNEVFGATANPWDTRLTCGGSSGGSAVALAAGQAWLATGNDMAGSLRIPGSFCSVVGFRPSPGRVAHGPLPLSFGMLNVDGPMARNVGDAALMLDAMVGHNVEDPISLPAPDRPFLQAVDQPVRPARIAWSPDLGLGPVHPEVRRVCEDAVGRLAGLGIPVDQTSPDLSGADRAFRVLRNAQRAAARDLYEAHRDKLGPEMRHYADVGLRQSAAELADAELGRARIYARMVAFFESYDILACPAVAAPPFPIEQRHVMELEGTSFGEPFGWLFLTFVISLTTCPAISVPCGFTSSGLPVGLQLVGRPRDEFGVLSAAALLETELGLDRLLPIDPRPGRTSAV